MQKVARFHKVSYERFLYDWMDSFGDSKETIKEILKMGVASYIFERDATDFREINNFNKSQEEVNHLINEYLPFNKEITKWEKDENGKYFANGTIPRLVVGTRSDIERALVNHGH